MKIHNIRYKNGGFYLTVNNLRGYFNFNINLGTLTILFDNINQQNKYYQVWKDIFKVINGEHGELKLFTYHARLVNILDFNPKKISIEKVCTINDEIERIYYVKYGGDPFYLVIDDLKGYFKYSKEKDTTEKELKSIIEDQRKRKIYNQIWDKIKELINSIDYINFRFSDYSRYCNVIRFNTDDTLPLDAMVSVYSMAIVIRSVYKTCVDRFYPPIYLKNCVYKTC